VGPALPGRLQPRGARPGHRRRRWCRRRSMPKRRQPTCFRRLPIS
jgi:hypothetical protein